MINETKHNKNNSSSDGGALIASAAQATSSADVNSRTAGAAGASAGVAVGAAAGAGRSSSPPSQLGQEQSSDDLLGLFNDVGKKSSSNNGSKPNAGGIISAAPGGGIIFGGGGNDNIAAGAATGARSSKRSSHPSNSSKRRPCAPPPPRPPPPYDTAFQVSSPVGPVMGVNSRRRNTISDSAGSKGALPVPETDQGSLLPSFGPPGSSTGMEFAEGSGSPPPLPPRSSADGAVVEKLLDLGDEVEGSGVTVGGGGGSLEYAAAAAPSNATSGAGQTEWWAASGAPEVVRSLMPPVRGLAASGGGMGSGRGLLGRSESTLVSVETRHRVRPISVSSLGPASVDVGVGGVMSGLKIGSSKNGAISCTRSTSLAEYGVRLPGVLQAARGGGVLSSNPRLLCVCCEDESSQAAAAGGIGAGAAAGAETSSTPPPVDVAEGSGHVSVLDLWHRGRTVRYPVAADRAAMSPNQSESVIAVLGGGSLHVFSIPRRCRLQEQAVATDLCMWRWVAFIFGFIFVIASARGWNCACLSAFVITVTARFRFISKLTTENAEFDYKIN